MFKRGSAPEKESSKKSNTIRLPREPWKLHDNYTKRSSDGNVVTRSQTPFNRIKNTDSDIAFFSEGVLQHPSDKPHVMVCLKGQHGAIPRTIVTRSSAQHLETDKELCKKVKEYKKLSKKDKLVQELKEYQKEFPNLLRPVDEPTEETGNVGFDLKPEVEIEDSE